MKTLILLGVIAMGAAAWAMATYGAVLRSERTREVRETRERNEHSEAGAVVRRPPVESQSTSLAAARDPMVGGW